MAMIKDSSGALEPSTYRGSVCLHFSTKAQANKKIWPPHMPDDRCYSRVRLVVRMYKGYYCRELANKVKEGKTRKCVVRLRIASGGLPIVLPKR